MTTLRTPHHGYGIKATSFPNLIASSYCRYD
jgi:hypothetical protein